MKKQFTPKSKQYGLSLVELMIASLLGLILTAGVIQIFTSTSQSYRFTENISRAQENGRFSMDILSRYIRMGGYATTQTDGGYPLAFAEPGCANVGGNVPCVEEGTGLNNSDRIAVQLDPPDDIDCNNNAVAANNIIRNVFWIAEDPANEVSTLYCQGFDTNTDTWIGVEQPYIAGIDSLQILFGVADDAETQEITRFVNSANVPAWNQVRSAKIAVLAQSGLDDATNTTAKNYVLLDNAPLLIDDGKNRYVFSTTVHMANSI